MDAAIKALQDELDKQGTVLSPEAADKQAAGHREAPARPPGLPRGRPARTCQRMKRARGGAGPGHERRVPAAGSSPHIDAVAKEKGIDILLTSQVALTMNQAYDISQEIIAKADEAAKTAAAAAPRGARGEARGPVPAAPEAGAQPQGLIWLWRVRLAVRCWRLATSLINGGIHCPSRDAMNSRLSPVDCAAARRHSTDRLPATPCAAQMAHSWVPRPFLARYGATPHRRFPATPSRPLEWLVRMNATSIDIAAAHPADPHPVPVRPRGPRARARSRRARWSRSRTSPGPRSSSRATSRARR